MFSFFQGVTLGAGMIIPLGAQNSFVINQGIKRNYPLIVAAVCAFCDIALISLGVFGGGEFISGNQLLLTLITWAGIAFLLSYGVMSFKSAYAGIAEEGQKSNKLFSLSGVIFATFAITLLNPHVFIDTVVVLGSVGAQFDGVNRLAFALGTMTISIVWFFSIASAAAKFSVWLNQPKVKFCIDVIVGLIMFAIAVFLFLSWLKG